MLTETVTVTPAAPDAYEAVLAWWMANETTLRAMPNGVVNITWGRQQVTINGPTRSHKIRIGEPPLQRR